MSRFENGITHHYSVTTNRELIILLTHVGTGQQSKSVARAPPHFN